jgi:hypothetical protein
MYDITVSQLDDKAEYQRQWRSKNPEKCKAYYDKRDKEVSREKAWLRRYGVTRDWYDETLAAQGGGCAICNNTEIGRRGHTHFHVDHNHSTGKVRGLLCDLCNRDLGYFKDNENLLTYAAEYLEKNK